MKKTAHPENGVIIVLEAPGLDYPAVMTVKSTVPQQ